MRYVLALLASASLLHAAEPAPPRPMLKDFLGVNGHTILFKPKLYRPAVALVRDYHPFDWDVGEDASTTTTFPFALNRVDWNGVYGSWKKEGFDVDVSIMFDNFKSANWKNPAADAEKYGRAFASAFGPSSRRLVSSVEVGNEPGKYDDAAYRKIFEGMAKGFRDGDPKLKIATSAAVPGKSHEYAKSLSCFKGLEHLYDAINIHTYAQAEPWPTWRRSYPEDPSIPYLKEVEAAKTWRDANAPGKPIWLTEFGWDCSTKPAPASGTFAKWKGNTEREQACWLVRSAMIFLRMEIDRAYIYFFNDDDAPQLHGSSGLTRKFKPKPSYHAVSHLQKTLGSCRFSRVVQESPGKVYVYEFASDANLSSVVWAVWSPTAKPKPAVRSLPLNGLRFLRAERMPLSDAPAKAEQPSVQDDAIEVSVEDAPLYLWLKRSDRK